MITGFNTDLEHEGRVYHVQTEDKGLDNPVIETLVYCGGEIVTSRRSSYENLVNSGEYSENAVLERMEEQHQAVFDEIRHDRHAPAEELPFGHAVVTNRSLDEVVRDFLSRHQAEPLELQLRMLDWAVLHAGTRPTVRLSVQEASRHAGVPEALVTVRLLAGGAAPQDLFSADTDSDGFVEASFEIPKSIPADAQIVFEAVKDEARAEFKRRVKNR